MVVCSSVRTIVCLPWVSCRFARLMPQHTAAGAGRRWLCSGRAGKSPHTAAALRRFRNLRRVVAHHRLGLEELVEAEFAPFAAVAGLLVAAERRAEIGTGAVQMHIAGAELRRDLARMLEVAGLHVTREAIHHVVGHADCLLLAVIGEDR